MLAIFTSVSAIRSSQVQRAYLKGIGFVAVGVHGGLHMLINRLYNMFPFCSIVCYLIIFYHLRQVGQQSSNLAVFNQNSGKRKIFEQILITASCYGAMAIFVEVVYFFELSWSANTNQLLFINLVTISNYLPEMSFPFLLLLQLIRIPNRVHIALGSAIRSRNVT